MVYKDENLMMMSQEVYKKKKTHTELKGEVCVVDERKCLMEERERKNLRNRG